MSPFPAEGELQIKATTTDESKHVALGSLLEHPLNDVLCGAEIRFVVIPSGFFQLSLCMGKA